MPLSKESILSGLNPEQKAAVEYNDGPLMILAGAGSGKTKTIISKIAYLINVLGINPERILGITFTTKAADEMRERLEQFCGKEIASQVDLRTFNSFGYKVCNSESVVRDELFKNSKELEEKRHEYGYIVRANLNANYENIRVLSEIESAQMIMTIIRTYARPWLSNDERFVIGLNDKAIYLYTMAKEICAAISKSYNLSKSVEDCGSDSLNRMYDNLDKHFPSLQKIKDEYRIYKTILEAIDFDDQLLAAKSAFAKLPEVLTRWQAKYDYILVDEYQDTNLVQYDVIKALFKDKESKNICVVGDMNQSIYGFRGANIGNITSFERDFKCKKITMSTNYRSTGNILKCANNLISHNPQINMVRLRTDKEPGQAVSLLPYYEEDLDKPYVAKTKDNKEIKINLISVIRGLIRNSQSTANPLRYEDIAILYRVNDQSKGLAKLFSLHNLPFNVKESKDLVEELEKLENGEKAALDLSKQTDNNEGIKLMTIHGSKGLEFRVVFLYGLNEEVFPLDEKNLLELEEERRICYVAITRAKEKLFLMYDKNGTQSLFIDETKKAKTTETPEEKLLSQLRGKQITIPPFGKCELLQIAKDERGKCVIKLRDLRDNNIKTKLMSEAELNNIKRQI